MLKILTITLPCVRTAYYLHILKMGTFFKTNTSFTLKLNTTKTSYQRHYFCQFLLLLINAFKQMYNGKSISLNKSVHKMETGLPKNYISNYPGSNTVVLVFPLHTHHQIQFQTYL